MKLYGITIVSSAGDIREFEPDGTINYCESLTKLFTTEKECINYALSAVDSMWKSYDFEDRECGTDDNDCTIDDIKTNIAKGDNDYIQGGDCHTTFEFFVQDMGSDIINRNDYIATKLWSEEDIVSTLQNNGYEGTPEQVAEVINSGALKNLSECTDDDWYIIDNAIDTCKETLDKLEVAA